MQFMAAMTRWRNLTCIVSDPADKTARSSLLWQLERYDMNNSPAKVLKFYVIANTSETPGETGLMLTLLDRLFGLLPNSWVTKRFSRH